MKKMVIFLLLTTCVIAITAIAARNRFSTPAPISDTLINQSGEQRLAPREIRLLTWNIGYAGMGNEANFILDGGDQMRPANAKLVRRNLAAISDFLSSAQTDVILLQEAARASFSTHQIDVMAELEQRLAGTAFTFGADIKTYGIPPPFNSEIGNAMFSKLKIRAAETRALPLEQTYQYGHFRKGYRMHVTYLDGPRPWVIINVHLSAFDPTKDNVRERQLAHTLAFAQTQYAAGHYVIIGGDLNLKMLATEFPHQSTEESRFWVRDFPDNLLPSGWMLAADADRPTARTADAAYVEGETYRLIIDGFILSPNIDLIKIRTIDLAFENSDHNPVTLTVRALE